MKTKYPRVITDRRKTITKAMSNRMFQLWEKGCNCNDIARRLNCSHWAVYSRVSPRGIEIKEAEPANQKEWKKIKLADPEWRKKYQDGKNKFIILRYNTEEEFKRYMKRIKS